MSVLSDSFATPWTVACQAPLSMWFSRQECWRGLPFPSPGESSQPRDWTRVSCIARRLFTVVPPGKPEWCYVCKLSHNRPFGTPWTEATRLLFPWDSPGKNTGANCHVLLQGSFRPRDWTQVSCDSCLGRRVLSPLRHVESPWVVLHRGPMPIFCMWIFSFSWRKKWQHIPVFLPREFHGQRSLLGFSPWGCKELDMTEQLTLTHSVFPTPSNDVIILPHWIFLTMTTFKRHLPS